MQVLLAFVSQIVVPHVSFFSGEAGDRRTRSVAKPPLSPDMRGDVDCTMHKYSGNSGARKMQQSCAEIRLRRAKAHVLFGIASTTRGVRLLTRRGTFLDVELG